MRLALALLLLPIACAGRARAQQPAPELVTPLHVEPSADGCIDEPALRERVARWLGPRAPSADLSVAVRAGREPVSFTLARGGEVVAERSFDVLPVACADRLNALALAIAVAIDPAVQERAARAEGSDATASATPADATPPAQLAAPQRDSATEPEPEPAPADAGRAGEAAAVETTETAQTAAKAWLHAGAGVLLETLPARSLLLDAGAELSIGRLRFAVAALVAPPTEVAFGGGRSDIWLVGARGHACLTTPAGSFGLEGCGGVAAGAAGASGEGFEGARDAVMGWTAGLLRAAVRFPENGNVSVRMALDGLVHLVRPRLALAGPGETPEALAGPIGAAASIEFLVALP